MKILDQYLSRELLKTLLFGIVALILVSTVVDLFERIDDIVQHKPPLSVTITFFLARIPLVVLMVTPIAILVSTLLVTGGFARHSEIIAMLANGVSIYRILVPLLSIGLLVSLLMFGLNEFVVPTANRIAAENKRIMRGKPDKSQIADLQIWFRGNQEKRIYYINALIPNRREIHGLTVFQLNDQFIPIKRVDALKAIYLPSASQTQEKQRPWTSDVVPKFFKDFLSPEGQENAPLDHGIWVLQRGSERLLEVSGKRTTINFQERRDYKIPQTFNDFRRETKSPEDMNYQELTQYIETLTASGYDVSEYIVDLRAKFSYPFVSLVMVIIGFPFALKSPRSGAVMGVGLSVFIGLTYWITLQLGISLGHARILPPLLAAWISHVIFAATGFYLILSTRT